MCVCVSQWKTREWLKIAGKCLTGEAYEYERRMDCGGGWSDRWSVMMMKKFLLWYISIEIYMQCAIFRRKISSVCVYVRVMTKSNKKIKEKKNQNETLANWLFSSDKCLMRCIYLFFSGLYSISAIKKRKYQYRNIHILYIYRKSEEANQKREIKK